MLPLACAACFALFQLTTRLVGRSDHPAATLAWTILVGLILTTPPCCSTGGLVAARLALMVASGLCFGGVQYVLTRAFARHPPPSLAPFTYTRSSRP